MSAQTVAFCRAVLTGAGLIDDPLAESMLHPPRRFLALILHGLPLAPVVRSPTLTFLAARTLFFDHEVIAALDEGIDQVVIVGAGYDTRAWRLGRPGVRFYEVDHPATQADKRFRAPPRGATYVAADLAADRIRTLLPAAGFETSKPAAFVVEGLTMYLTEEAVHALLGDLAALSRPGSRLAVNFTVRGGGSTSPVSRGVAWTTRTVWRLRGEPTYGWVRPEALPELLHTTGWGLRELILAPQLVATYLADPRTGGLNPGAICVAAQRAT